jgi:peroxiredoxin
MIKRYALAFLALILMPTWGHAFTLKDTSGVTHRIAGYKGQWVVINFWATWCAPCIKEIPDFAKFHTEFGPSGAKRVQVIGIATDVDDKAKTLKFAKDKGLTYPLVLATPQTEKQFGPIRGMPTTLIYGPDGRLTLRKEGPMTYADLVKATS